MGVLHVLGFPLRILRSALSQLFERGDTRLLLSLPVAGLEEATAHQILFTLRAAASTPEDVELANQWLAALAIAQIVSDRLVSDLQLVSDSLDFWVERLRQGQHLRAMLFGQGPVSFAKDAYRLVTRQRGHHQTATDSIEHRVIVLRGMRSKLAEALAQVHAAAGQLHLKAARSAADSSAPADSASLLAAAKAAVEQSLLLTIRARADVVSYLRREIGLLEAPAEFRKAALTQMLLARSKRMFSHGLNGSGSRSQAPARNGEGTPNEQPAGESGKADTAAAALLKAEQALGISLQVTQQTSAHKALLEAASLAAQQAQLVALPPWLAVPSRYRRNWIAYSVLGAGFGFVSIFLFRHSRLAGSDDLEQWGRSAVLAIQSAYQEHMLKPLLAVRDELFQTFRQRRSIVSPDDFEADKESLMRMLHDFRKDNASASNPVVQGAGGPSLLEAADLRGNLDFMMAHYEAELKKPIRSLVTGRLPRTLLIQVQKLKVDTEAAMLQCDQILRANELSIALVAAIPAFIIGGLTIIGIFKWLSPSPPDQAGEAFPCRMAMVEVERAVQALTEGQSAEEQGLLIYRLALVHEAAVRLYRRRRLQSGASAREWRNLRADLAQLAAPKPVKQKAQIVKRMMRVYTVFRA